MELSTFLYIYTELAPLRMLLNTYPSIDTTTLVTLFLRPAPSTFAREMLFHQMCDLLIMQPPLHGIFGHRRMRSLWAQVTENNRLRKRFCYSSIPLTEAEAFKMWRMVDAMQAEGGTIRECSAMFGIPQDSFIELQRAWRLSHDSEENAEFLSVSTADIATPVASPHESPRAEEKRDSQLFEKRKTRDDDDETENPKKRFAS